MSRKLLWLCVLAVCLLALAGSFLRAGKTSSHRFASLRASAKFLAKTPDRNLSARSAPSRDPFPAARKSAANLSRQSPLSLPFAFEPNVGQADSRVAFIGRGRGLTVFLKSREIVAQIAGTPHAAHAISMRITGAPGLAWKGRKKLRGETNYFLGNDPRRWRTHVPHFAEVSATSAAPGVGIVLYGNDEGVEYDLRVASGADLSALRLKIDGADEIRLAPNGDILLQAAGGQLRMKKPVVYQESGGANAASKRQIDGAYILEGNGSLAFRIGPHDPHAALIIDPSLSVAYATFLGGNGTDVAASVALDAAGKVYVGGTTTSPGTFPGASHTLGPGGGTSEFFIAKIDPTIAGANSLVYLTFLGGSQTQTGGLIAVTSSGSVAITGTTTSPDFPVTDSSLPTNALTTGVGNDVAVSEIGPSGSTLVFSTIFGGSGAESQNGTGAIALDSSGDVYVASDTNTTSLDAASADLPVTAGAYAATWDGDESDGFLTIFTPPAQPGGAATLKYCSYLGTNALALVSVGGIAVDSTGSAYIAGGVENGTTAFPYTNAFQSAYGGGASDAFLMKISPLSQGSVDLVYATFLGGSGTDQALAVALDTNSNPSAYVTGATDSTDFPMKGLIPGFSTSLNSDAAANAFLVVVGQGATGQTSLLYSTYLGGSAADAGQSLAVVAPNKVYVGGTTTSWDFPWHDNIQPFNGQQVAFVAKFDPTSAGAASLIYATPLGGTSSASQSGGAAGNAVAVNSTGAANLVYLAGATTSPDFPTAITSIGGSPNGSQPSCSSCGVSPPATDAFLAELQENSSLEPAVTFNLPRLSFFSAATQYLGLTNTGESPLNITAIALAGPNSADFLLSGQLACTSQPLNPGGSCPLSVDFSPSGSAYETAVIRVTDNAPGSPQEFELLGVAPGLAASPVGVSFPPQATGVLSDPQQVTLTVVSPVKQTMTIDAAPSLGGANPGQFQLAAGGNPCAVGTPMNSNATCSVSAIFVPQSAGSFQSEIDVSYHFNGSSEQKLVVPLAGSATQALSASVSVVSSVNFGSQLAQSAGTPQPITITNSATGPNAGPLTFTGVSVKGPSSNDFDITTDSCTTGSVSPGGTCTVQIAFRPLQASVCGTDSTRNATLTLTDNAPGSPQSVALTGAAEDFCPSSSTGDVAILPITPGSPPTISPYPQLLVSSSAGFSGNVMLSCSVTPVETEGPTCTMSASSVPVSPTTPGQFTVSVTTTAPTSTSRVPGARRPQNTPPNYRELVGAFLVAVAVLIAAARSKKRSLGLMQAAQTGALFLALAAALAACGGGAASDPSADPGTPVECYTITVTATVSSTTASRTLQLPLPVGTTCTVNQNVRRY
jgi:hypothetical protein